MTTVVLTSQKGLIEELWEYFVQTYFSPEVPYLENFSFGTGTLLSIRNIVVGLTIGIVLASAFSIYNKRYMGDFIRKLISEECLDARSAKTLYELGYLKKSGIRSAIKSGGVMSRWVRCAEEDEYNAKLEQERLEFEELHKDEENPPKFEAPEFIRDCKTMHFYIPEEKKYTADVKFDAKGANWRSFFLVVIVSLVLCLFICFILPDAIKLVDNFITTMNNL
jgi:multisubunit Na+/H+ antiporter MnhB subunit